MQPRTGEGSCLGLALAAWIADRHGATIHVSSQPGKGSTFTVRLPAASGVAATPAPAGGDPRGLPRVDGPAIADRLTKVH